MSEAQIYNDLARALTDETLAFRVSLIAHGQVSRGSDGFAPTERAALLHEAARRIRPGDGPALTLDDVTDDAEDPERLIAAAPDLLAELREVAEMFARVARVRGLKGYERARLTAVQRVLGSAYGAPWCNHDAAAVHNGVCECGEVVS